MIPKQILTQLYNGKKMSMKQISVELGCSVHKVAYWMEKHSISRRSRSESIYIMHNPLGDPFAQTQIDSLEKAELLGYGLGLYWGEGNKKNKYSLRLGNTDPNLIKKYIEFLEKIFNVKKDNLRYGLQIFTDISEERAVEHWCKLLNADRKQFYKTTITPSKSVGTYRQKSEFGVLTVYYHNKKLRDIIVQMLPK
jgi:hypothetical protein